MTNEFHLANARRIAHLLDDRFELAGIKIGLDPLLDLVPGIGDVIASLVAFYILFVAVKFKLPGSQLARMVFNWLVDFVIGLIPVLGTISTVFYRSNRWNIHILEDYLQKNGGRVEEGRLIA